MSEAERLLFDLRFTDELSIKEIAVIIHIPEGTVKSRLHTLVQKLRKKLHCYV
jgi:RNA polymerase sigma-70 factor (ECF subfamily)